ncbi:hypothetical protein Fmac_012573 [Flemingia macrophylla]|uniref:Uncharacterized protein n=1 Tax=Flemingia macrophylla TaxID=520843 RepID=A0ABD1MQN8_9FABA
MASHDQSYRAGEAKGRTEEKANQTMGNVGQKAQEAKEKTKGAAQGAKEKAQEKSRKDNAGGFLQKTGEKVKEVAHSATEAVKHTFGMAPQTDEDKEYYTTHHRREY